MKQATFRSPRDIYPNLQHPCHREELEEMRQEVQKKQLELQAVKTVVQRWNPLKLERLQFLPWNRTTPDFTGNNLCVCVFFGVFHFWNGGKNGKKGSMCSGWRISESDVIRLMHLQRDELVFNQYQYMFWVRKLWDLNISEVKKDGMLEFFLFSVLCFTFYPGLFFCSPSNHICWLLGLLLQNHPQIQDVIVWDGAAWAICRVKGPTRNVAADLNPKQGVLQKRAGYFWWV